MNAPFLHVEQIENLLGTIQPDTIVSRTVVNEPGLRVIIFGFAPGQELSEHTSARTAILHFLRGQVQLRLGEAAQVATPGTLVLMQPHLSHSVVAETETVMLLYMVGQ